MRIIPERDLAEDVLQDVYFKVWRRAGRYDHSIGSPISWLAVIARNTAIDEIRRQRGPAHEGDDELDLIADNSQPVDEMLCDREQYDAVNRCLEALEANQRKSIRLAFFGGFSHSQLAEKLEVPLGTMKAGSARSAKPEGVHGV